MKICIIGGGNIGTQFACVSAMKGNDVTVCSSSPDSFSDTLTIVDENENTVSAKISCSTSDLASALSGAKVVFVTYPAFMLKDLADQMLPYITEGMKIGVIPGTGGAEFAFAPCIRKGAVLFGLQRVPAVARLEEYGKRVRVEGKRDRLHLCSIPGKHSEEIAELMSDLFDMPCEILPNYLCVTLTPSNPILHTTRLKTLFADYRPGTVYPRNPLFYGDWSLESSKLLLACDAELQGLCGKIDLDLKDVRSLRLHYESDTAEALTEKLRSISSLHSIRSPMLKTENGWIPDFDSRYFTADFPYGLAVIEELADLFDYPVPNVTETLQWYLNQIGSCKCFRLEDYGIHSRQEFLDLYR